ncbi:MAG TPA: substrate-binding domain-containing protein [Solirubrobacteraceae bacterium]|nr:substrate-binding domain-containing protein [Solirubrobacteraceae bacterium]
MSEDEASGDLGVSLSALTRRTALTGGAAGVAAALLAACGGSPAATTTTQAGSPAPTVFGSSRHYRFAFINHEVDNAFFNPTKYGAADACQLLGCSFDWTGSTGNNVAEEVEAIYTAVAARVDGIATTIIDPEAFNAPVRAALAAGIPVVSYNSDEPNNPRLAYLGQDLAAAGQLMGQRIQSLLPDGGEIAIFISAPGLASVKPRVDGALRALRGTGIKATVVGSGASATQQATVIDAFMAAHPRYNGFFGADQGSTQTIGAAVQKGSLAAKGVAAGGFDPNTQIEQLIASGDLNFAIDQQPYLQGFMAIVQMYLYRVSKGLTGIADMDTGLKLVSKRSISPYVNTVSRFEGSSTSPGVQSA